jgi:REP element-mobilizing transposase RayT
MRRRRTRIPTFDYIGQYRYLLTFCTRHRRKLFTDEETVTLARDQILRAATIYEFALPAYVFMPDHTHLPVGRSESSDLQAFVKLAKQESGYAFSAAYGDRLWQPSFDDRMLRDDEPGLRVVCYIVWNPVRAGLVSKPEDYPFLGSTTHSVAEIVRMCGGVSARRDERLCR